MQAGAADRLREPIAGRLHLLIPLVIIVAFLATVSLAGLLERRKEDVQ
jgi:hypothetical protein